MINPIKFKSTIVSITPEARKKANLMFSDDLACLMFSAMSKYKTAETAPNGFVQKLKHKFKTPSQLTIKIDSASKDDFTLQASRSVGNIVFSGEKVKFDLTKLLDTYKDFDRALSVSKESILEKLTDYNLKKNFFKLKK